MKRQNKIALFWEKEQTNIKKQTKRNCYRDTALGWSTEKNMRGMGKGRRDRKEHGLNLLLSILVLNPDPATYNCLHRGSLSHLWINTKKKQQQKTKKQKKISKLTFQHCYSIDTVFSLLKLFIIYSFFPISQQHILYGDFFFFSVQ